MREVDLYRQTSADTYNSICTELMRANEALKEDIDLVDFYYNVFGGWHKAKSQTFRLYEIFDHKASFNPQEPNCKLQDKSGKTMTTQLRLPEFDNSRVSPKVHKAYSGQIIEVLNTYSTYTNRDYSSFELCCTGGYIYRAPFGDNRDLDYFDEEDSFNLIGGVDIEIHSSYRKRVAIGFLYKDTATKEDIERITKKLVDYNYYFACKCKINNEECYKIFKKGANRHE